MQNIVVKGNQEKKKIVLEGYKSIYSSTFVAPRDILQLSTKS